MSRTPFHRMLLAAAGLVLLAASPSPTPEPTPSTFDLLKQLENRVVEDKARGKRLVIGIDITDTKEGFTVELSDDRVQVRQGLPKRAVAVLSGSRSVLEKVLSGSETVSGAVRRNLVDVQGDLDQLLDVINCCVHRPN